IFNSNANKSVFSAIGLNLTIPIFNGGATKSKINQANIEIKKVQVDLEDSKLGLNLASENAKAQIKNSLLTIDANKRNVQLANEVLDDTQNNYRNGLATLTDLLDAENAYADAQNNLNTSLLNYKVAEVQLIKANGNLTSLVNE
ncbi:MAG: TolC family protein, partial [Sphingobacterium sp.]